MNVETTIGGLTYVLLFVLDFGLSVTRYQARGLLWC
jgi:hypothetical protein